MFDPNTLGDVSASPRLNSVISKDELEVHLIKAMPPVMRTSFGCVPVYYNFFGRVGGRNLSEWLLGFPEIDHPDWLPVLRHFILYWRRSIDATLDAVELSVLGQRKRPRPTMHWIPETERLAPIA